MEKGRVVLITGAAGGMGALFARRFLAHGDTVIATDTSDEALAKLANGSADGAKLFTLAADISDQASCAKLAAFALAKAGHVDVLVNCAGIFPTRAFMSLADWNKVRHQSDRRLPDGESNLAPDDRRGWGRITNIGSGSMFDGVDTQVHYVAAKAGVLCLSRSLARIVGKDGITVNLVTPGLTMTPAVARAMPLERVQAQVKARAIQRDETGEDLFGTVFFRFARRRLHVGADPQYRRRQALQRNLLGERTTR